MNEIKTLIVDQDFYALEFAWGQYRVYAKTSNKRKVELTNWRFRVLVFAIAGAILGVLCQESIRLELDVHMWQHFSKLLGGLSALLLGLGTYFGKELVNPEKERNWIRSRSIAEAFKAECYLFLTNVPPYDKDGKAKRLNAETEKLLESVRDLSHLNLSKEEMKENLPSDMLNVDGYIETRVRDQIDNFYNNRVNAYTKKMEDIRNIGLGLGILAIIFGALGSTGWTAGWVAVISTITASIVSYAYANRYQYLVISYQATAKRLELILNRWKISRKTDADTDYRNYFILNCEEAISIENSAWMSEIIKEDHQQTKLAARIFATQDNQEGGA